MNRMALLLASFCLSLCAWGNPTPAGSEKLLWLFSRSSVQDAGKHAHIYCATTKGSPYLPKLCFSETRRTDLNNLPQASIEIQRSENGPKETLMITSVSTWKYLGTTSEYVANSDIYVRSLQIADSAGRVSILNETFDFYANYDDGSKLRTRSVSGTLPDGTPVSLSNIYWYP